MRLRPERKTTVTKKLLRITGMRTLRSIAGYTYLWTKREMGFSGKNDIHDIVTWVRQRWREWTDHVDRTSNKRLAKKNRTEC